MLSYEKHEPATINKNNYSYIQINNHKPSTGSEKNWCFVDAPADIKLLNRYIVEKEQILEFMNMLQGEYQIYSCIHLSGKSNRLTNIQRKLKESKISKNGWSKNSSEVEVFIKSIDMVDEVIVDILSDISIDSILLITKKDKPLDDILRILKDMDFFIQPQNAIAFYLTKNNIDALISNDVGVVFFERLLKELKARDIFVSYFPERLACK